MPERVAAPAFGRQVVQKLCTGPGEATRHELTCRLLHHPLGCMDRGGRGGRDKL